MRKSVEIGVFSRGWVILGAKFRWKRTSLPTAVGVRKECLIKISAVYSFVLSQSTRLTDRQNYDSQDRASIAASRGKNLWIFLLYNSTMQALPWASFVIGDCRQCYRQLVGTATQVRASAAVTSRATVLHRTRCRTNSSQRATSHLTWPAKTLFILHQWATHV